MTKKVITFGVLASPNRDVSIKVNPSPKIICLTSMIGIKAKTMDNVFPTIYVFPTRDNSAGTLQNVIFVVTKTDTEFGKDDFSLMANKNGLVGVLEDVEYYYNYYDAEVNTQDVPLLTDQFAPVETLLNPVTSKPYEIDDLQPRDTPSWIPWSESTQVIMVLLITISIFWLIYLKTSWTEEIRKEKKF